MTIVMLFFCVNNIKRKKNKKKEESKKNNTGDGGNKFAKFVLLGFDRFFFPVKNFATPAGFRGHPVFYFFPQTVKSSHSTSTLAPLEGPKRSKS